MRRRDSEKHRFTTYERDSESSTDYAINRQYQTVNGRFIQADVVGGSILDPQSTNRYSYALNDPMNLTDPMGLDSYDWMTDASKHGPGVYLDGMEVMPEMYSVVFNLLAIGAAEIDFAGRAFLEQAPEWYEKEYGLQDPNDYLPSLSFSGFSFGLITVGVQTDIERKFGRSKQQIKAAKDCYDAAYDAYTRSEDSARAAAAERFPVIPSWKEWTVAGTGGLVAGIIRGGKIIGRLGAGVSSLGISLGAEFMVDWIARDTYVDIAMKGPKEELKRARSKCLEQFGRDPSRRPTGLLLL